MRIIFPTNKCWARSAIPRETQHHLWRRSLSAQVPVASDVAQTSCARIDLEDAAHFALSSSPHPCPSPEGRGILFGSRLEGRPFGLDMSAPTSPTHRHPRAGGDPGRLPRFLRKLSSSAVSEFRRVNAPPMLAWIPACAGMKPEERRHPHPPAVIPAFIAGTHRAGGDRFASRQTRLRHHSTSTPSVQQADQWVPGTRPGMTAERMRVSPRTTRAQPPPVHHRAAARMTIAGTFTL